VRGAALAGAEAVAAAAVLFAAGFLDVAPAWRVVIGIAGLYLAYRALGHAARAVAGREVDVAFGLCLAWLAVLGAAILLAPLLPLGESSDTSKTLLVPGFLGPDLFTSHPLGTNQQGLDMLARVVWGGRESMAASMLAVLIGITLGGVLGVVAGYFGGVFDGVIGIATSVGLAFPPLVLLLVVAAALPDGILGLAITLAVFVVPSTIRIARANTLTVAQRDYALAARLLGATRWQVARREVIPHVLPPLISMGLLILPLLIVAEASLNFLGLGVAAPAPSWGNMISEGTNGVFEDHPFIVLVPGTVLFITVFVLNALGQRVSRVWDPRRNKL
jgi:peptide/nickel transport system permease protein